MQCDFMGGEKYIASVPCLEKEILNADDKFSNIS